MVRLAVASAIAVAVGCFDQAAIAADIAVRTGEHAGFTRLVVEDPAIAAWQIGRTPEGYALRISPGARGFDLSGAFRLISRKRLSSLRETAGGDLQLGIACACHVEPVEIRTGVIVIDIHDGPASPTSDYERPLPAAGERVATRIRPKARPDGVQGYDWRKVDTPDDAVDLNLGMSRPALDAMRHSLVQQLSRGAAAGAVDFVADLPPDAASAAMVETMPQVQVLTEAGFDPSASDRPVDQLTATGADCIADDRVDVASWNDESPVAEQMATALAGLTGEFDDPRPEALATAVRFYLSLGFGAEARQLLKTFASDNPDRGIWETMALVLDGARQPQGALTGMATCDTRVALWSVLADPPAASRSVNTPAVLRGFSALPAHLRRHLGPRLAEDFMARGDAASARAVRDAMMRAPGAAGEAADLTDARLAVAEGMTPPVEKLASISARPGPTGAEALAMLVERQVASGERLSAQDVLGLAALLQEHRGSQIGARLGHAYRLALAATGDFDQAFARYDLAPDADAEVWRLLAGSGPSSEILARGVLADDQTVPDLPVPTRRAMAGRLLDLGLAAPARRWMEAVSGDADEDRLILARIALEERRASQVLGALAGLSGEEADRLRAAARRDLQVGTSDPTPTRTAGDAVSDLANSDPSDPQVTPPSPASEVGEDIAGPLARSRALVEASASARSRIEDLLRTAGQ